MSLTMEPTPIGIEPIRPSKRVSPVDGDSRSPEFLESALSFSDLRQTVFVLGSRYEFAVPDITFCRCYSDDAAISGD